MHPKNVSRRQLLAGVASMGAASIAGLAFATERSRAFTETTQLQTGSIDGLLLDWREKYNDTPLTDTTDGAASPSPTGPAISLGNVLPGDSGSLSVQLRLDTENEDADDVEVETELSFDLTGDLQSPGLQEFIHAAVWYDTGFLEVDAFGARNAERDPGEQLVHPDAEGTLEDVTTALSDGVALDTNPNAPTESTCLSGSDKVTVTFWWWFPTDQENINAVQGDTVEFDIRFDAEQC
ncbi:hypothetical protein AArcSl_2772 [Halalkaliarchaeum desulfuricum]|uniref:Uncharacterized protein n=1 Tax=Halalkaliarchaeum desulfuricum TaxID=2055893 RepID=A0A343TMR5_9EURY|nr:hypothetical protein [Halalkaliarchaeum desulfuricum]AUX10387.1 hypothetical protein AArcSl_2772 [Halalkaliarchaeum desulfuricum]